MKDLRKLSSQQDGVVYIEQLESWLTEIEAKLYNCSEVYCEEYKEKEGSLYINDVISILRGEEDE